MALQKSSLKKVDTSAVCAGGIKGTRQRFQHPVFELRAWRLVRLFLCVGGQNAGTSPVFFGYIIEHDYCCLRRGMGYSNHSLGYNTGEFRLLSVRPAFPHLDPDYGHVEPPPRSIQLQESYC